MLGTLAAGPSSFCADRPLSGAMRSLLATDLPEREPLPRWIAPVPEWIENLGLRLVWLVVVVNLLGTAFGFWFYIPQFMRTPELMWPFVPDSPVATLLAALAFASWKLGRPNQVLIALAFFGNVILGAWTPYVLVVFAGEWGYHPAMWSFLFVSHLAMVVQAFVLHRIGDFPVWAVAVATVWYGIDFVVDFLIPIVGDTPHHTVIAPPRDAVIALGGTALGWAAAGAFLLTLWAAFFALATRVKKLEAAGGVCDGSNG